MSNSNYAEVIVYFDVGREVLARMVRCNDKLKLAFDMPRLKPGSEANIIQEIQARTSCTSARRVVVKRVSGSVSVIGEPLKARVELALDQNDFSPIPAHNARLSLAPKDNDQPINVIVGKTEETDHNRATLVAEYEIPDMRIGAKIKIEDENGGMIIAQIERAEFQSLNSGINIAGCIMIAKKIGYEPMQEKAPEPEETKNSVQSDSKVKAESENQDPPNSQDDSRTRETEPPRTAILPGQQIVSPKKDNAKPLIIALCSLAGMILAAITSFYWHDRQKSDVQQNEQTTPPNPTPTMSSAPAPEERIVLEAPVSIDEQESIFLPMTSRNLEAFFGQSNTLKVYGKISGRSEPGKLGINCAVPPRYNSVNDTTDISACLIALPTDATPGEFRLTKKTARAWFHQTDPACMQKIAHLENSTDVETLRINTEKCAWHFDPVKSCFDYSKCTFTIPNFEM